MLKTFLFRCVAIVPANGSMKDSFLAIFSVPITVWIIAFIEFFFSCSKSDRYVLVGIVFVSIHLIIKVTAKILDDNYQAEINNFRKEKERYNNYIIVSFVFLMIFLLGVLYFKK
jgi:hypothetical protein